MDDPCGGNVAISARCGVREVQAPAPNLSGAVLRVAARVRPASVATAIVLRIAEPIMTQPVLEVEQLTGTCQSVS